jgi:UDP-glucose 4-epimerase
MKSVAITGGCGFIGSNLTTRLLDEGYSVTVIDDLSNGHIEFLDRRAKFCQADFADDWRVLSEFREKKFDTVFHLAANPRVSYSMEHPYETFNTNVSKTVKLIDACAGNIDRFIFASSCSVYGTKSSIPITENDSVNPESHYAMHKLIIENVLSMYAKSHNFNSVKLRFFNVYGKRQLGSSPYSTAVSAWLTAVKTGTPMRSDGDGSQRRDLVHVDDVVEAMILAATTPGVCSTYNIASGETVVNSDILDHLLWKFPRSSFVKAPKRPGDVDSICANIDKAFTELKYSPKVKFWKTGLEKTIDWAMNDPSFTSLKNSR